MRGEAGTAGEHLPPETARRGQMPGPRLVALAPGAALAPAALNVLPAAQMSQHFAFHGTLDLRDPAPLGQRPVRAFEAARAATGTRSIDIVIVALLEPFANPRIHIRLWGDAIFDPPGSTLLAVGLATCLRCAALWADARLLLSFLLFALSLAFVSPVDRVDIVHAVAMPVPVALLAAAGFAVLPRLLAAVLPARVGERPWPPDAPADRWRSWRCEPRP